MYIPSDKQPDPMLPGYRTTSYSNTSLSQGLARHEDINTTYSYQIDGHLVGERSIFIKSSHS